MNDLIRRAKFLMPVTVLCGATACSLIPNNIGARCCRVAYAFLIVRYGVLLLFCGGAVRFQSA
jgi:hypothetical protein